MIASEIVYPPLCFLWKNQGDNKKEIVMDPTRAWLSGTATVGNNAE